jgi:hypothetical protein
MPRTGPMHHTSYRGYNVSVLHEDHSWRAWVRPRLPELPIYRWHSFIVRGVSQDEALAEIKRRIDDLILT